MNIKDIIQNDTSIYRIISLTDDKALVVDCLHKSMPVYISLKDLLEGNTLSEAELYTATGNTISELEDLTPVEKKTALQRYTLIAGILAVISNERQRSYMIQQVSDTYGVSKQTVRKYLYIYLVYQNIAALVPTKKPEKALTPDQCNMRWALNKFYYNRNQNSLNEAYTMMLRSKYTDSKGVLLSKYPTLNQFRYFYRKTKKLENYYICREGIKDYQKNHRPLLGDGVQEFAPQIGTAMLDSTVLDIYLVDESKRVVGRPVLVAAIDANTSMCLGYSLVWEGGTYSLQQLMLNILEDKVHLCERMGIKIDKKQWDVENTLPSVFVTDGGSEYMGQTFSQITELGISLVKLPSFRAELKGMVEKFFDLVQSLYKKNLIGKGVIMPDFQQRGAHDYRLDSCLTIEDFEKIIVRCIVYYNSERLLDNYPYSEDMLKESIKPYASDIWSYKKNIEGNNLIKVTKRDLCLTLMPRTSGNFTRFGLKVNKLRYHADGYKEVYLEYVKIWFMHFR